MQTPRCRRPALGEALQPKAQQNVEGGQREHPRQRGARAPPLASEAPFRPEIGGQRRDVNQSVAKKGGTQVSKKKNEPLRNFTLGCAQAPQVSHAIPCAAPEPAKSGHVHCAFFCPQHTVRRGAEDVTVVVHVWALPCNQEPTFESGQARGARWGFPSHRFF